MSQPPAYSQVSKETKPPNYSQPPQKPQTQSQKREKLKKALHKLGGSARDGLFGTTEPVLYRKH